MILKNIFFTQLVVFILFGALFIISNLAIEYYIEDINQTKSHFPIMVYTNTFDEVIDIIEYVTEQDIYQTHYIQFPDSLESMLISKYNLQDYKDFIADLKLPYQIEIYINPFPIKEIMDFTHTIKEDSLFAGNIIQYNELEWTKLDKEVQKLHYFTYALQFVLLLIYLLLQYIIRLSLLDHNKNHIAAYLRAGIPKGKLRLISFGNNLLFLFLASLTIIIVDVFINVYEIMSKIIINYEEQNNYFNVELIIILISINVILLFTQRSLWKTKKA